MSSKGTFFAAPIELAHDIIRATHPFTGASFARTEALCGQVFLPRLLRATDNSCDFLYQRACHQICGSCEHRAEVNQP